MAAVAAERLNQLQDQERTIDQAMTDYRRLGYSERWITQRLRSIEVRKERSPTAGSPNRSPHYLES